MSITLQVEGMSCQHCVANVKNALEALDGVSMATPDLASGEVAIDGDNLSAELLAQAIIEAGYKVKS